MFCHSFTPTFEPEIAPTHLKTDVFGRPCKLLFIFASCVESVPPELEKFSCVRPKKVKILIFTGLDAPDEESLLNGKYQYSWPPGTN